MQDSSAGKGLHGIFYGYFSHFKDGMTGFAIGAAGFMRKVVSLQQDVFRGKNLLS